MPIEDEHPDVLQNIEATAVTLYRQFPVLSDWQVERTWEALLDRFVAERIGRDPRPWSPDELEETLYERAARVCDWRLGRASSPWETPEGEPGADATIDVETLIACLKRLLRSVRKWTRAGGRQGYLEFVDRYIV